MAKADDPTRSASEDARILSARASLTEVYCRDYLLVTGSCRRLLGHLTSTDEEDVAIDVLRAETARSRRQEPATDSPHWTDVEGAVFARQWQQAIMDRIHGLSLEQREAIDLTFFAGYTYRSAAVVLGLPEGTVKSRVRAALAHLRTALRDHDDGNTDSRCRTLCLTSPHLTSPHLTSPHLTSPHLTSPHLTSPGGGAS